MTNSRAENGELSLDRSGKLSFDNVMLARPVTMYALSGIQVFRFDAH